MSQTCQYIWKTTSKKGQKCGRKLLKSDSQYCFQHKKITAVTDKEVKQTETKPTKMTYIQLDNTKHSKKIK
jgi:hypothetical protein